MLARLPFVVLVDIVTPVPITGQQIREAGAQAGLRDYPLAHNGYDMFMLACTVGNRTDLCIALVRSNTDPFEVARLHLGVSYTSPHWGLALAEMPPHIRSANSASVLNPAPMPTIITKVRQYGGELNAAIRDMTPRLG
jgi:hypothetical protein